MCSCRLHYLQASGSAEVCTMPLLLPPLPAAYAGGSGAAVALFMTEAHAVVSISSCIYCRPVLGHPQAKARPANPKPRCSTSRSRAPAAAERYTMSSLRQRAAALAAAAAVALAVLAPPAAAAVPDPLRLRPPGCDPKSCAGCVEYSLHVSRDWC